MEKARLGSIRPMFIVTDVGRTIDFYREKLGFETQLKQPDDEPFFAIIGRDNVQLFIKAEDGIAPIPNHRQHRHMRLDASIYTADPDRLATEFAERGVIFSKRLGVDQDQLLGFEIKDPDGYTLFFGRPN